MKNVEELRDFLSKEIRKVSDGETTPASANASANLVGKMLGSIKLELEYNKMTGNNPDISFLGKAARKTIEKLEHIV